MRNTKRTQELQAIRQQRRRELVRATYLWAKQRAIVARMEVARGITWDKPRMELIDADMFT